MHTTFDYNGCAIALDQREADRAAKRAKNEKATELQLRVLRLTTRVRSFTSEAGWFRGRVSVRRNPHDAERAVRFQRAADHAMRQLCWVLAVVQR